MSTLLSTSTTSRVIRRLMLPVALITLSAGALTGCGNAASPDSVVLLDSVLKNSAPGSEPVTWPFIGEPETFTVPTWATQAQVTVAGGSGGGVGGGTTAAHQNSGLGAVLTGILPITGGEQMTFDIGGHGGAYQGNQSPGAGGWGILAQFQGGRGGGGYGADASDGDGGGGATVIMTGSTPLVVAGGGGGMGGRLDLLMKGGFSGGTATSGDGGQGAKLSNGTGGRGGSDAQANLNPQGGTASHTVIAGGGGGGGGGVHPGEGGDKSGTAGGYGGGAGQSLSSNLTGLTVTTNGPAADGYITIAFS